MSFGDQLLSVSTKSGVIFLTRSLPDMISRSQGVSCTNPAGELPLAGGVCAQQTEPEAWITSSSRVPAASIVTCQLVSNLPQEGCPKRVVFVLKETEPEAWISNGGDFAAYLKPPGVDEVVDKAGAFCSRSIVTFHRLAAILPPSLCRLAWTRPSTRCALDRQAGLVKITPGGHRRRLAVERFRLSAAATGRHSHTTSLPAALGRQSARDDD